MSDLIERLEAATEGSGERDIETHQALGWELAPPEAGCGWWNTNGDTFDGDCPHYTTSIDAKLPGENIVTVIRVLGGFIAEHAEVYESGDVRCFKSTAATEALARRSAALRARQSETAPDAKKPATP